MLTKNALQKELFCGQEPAIELMYITYGGMLYGYVLQFVPDEQKAESLLSAIFYRLGPRLQEACDSSLSIYCWLQIEARKIILDIGNGQSSQTNHSGQEFRDKVGFSSLLNDASPEHREVFCKHFLYGIPTEDLASQAAKDLDHINRLLRESLLLIRKRLK
jgi:DNA-directed RNA polymerase specialized sigma24 family protein